MAFFDFDRKVQTLIIAGAIATASACGGTTDIQGESDGDTGTDTAMDTAMDTGFDTDAWPEMVDPPPDMLDPDAHGICPDPATWQVSVSTHEVTWPTMLVRVLLNVPPEFIDESFPEFSVEKKSIDEVREISRGEYELVYRWSGPIEYGWWDWDRISVTWRVLCADVAGSHERVLTTQQIICVSEGYMYMGWGSDPESACMVVDCVPDSMGYHSAPIDTSPSGVDSRPADIPDALPKGALVTRIVAVPASAGAIHLTARSTGSLSAWAEHAWTVTAGRIEADGASAVWYPPVTPGLHVAQVTTTCGPAVSIDVFKIKI